MGCASIAIRSMIPALKELSHKFELVGIASRQLEKVLPMAQRFGCEAIEGYDALLDRSDVEAIYMPLPTGLHKEWVIKALAAGKHVYVEKSLAASLEDATNMVALARKNKCALMEGYMFQYHSQHRKTFEFIDNGLLGDIRHFMAAFGFPPLSANNFRYDATIGGGVMMDAAGYTVRAAHFILNQPLMVCGAAVHYHPDTTTSLWGSAFMKSKGNVGVSLSFGFDNFYQCNYTIWGSKAKLTLMKAFTPKVDERPLLVLERQNIKEEISLPADNHFIHAMEHFHQIIQDQNFELDYAAILQQNASLDAIMNLS